MLIPSGIVIDPEDVTVCLKVSLVASKPPAAVAKLDTDIS
jgi:hypothetical protein